MTLDRSNGSNHQNLIESLDDVHFIINCNDKNKKSKDNIAGIINEEEVKKLKEDEKEVFQYYEDLSFKARPNKRRKIS